jgi:hypothetical protein
MISKITGGPTRHLFTTSVLNKYNVQYFECLDTGFIQTEEPFWLEEAYSSAITKLDIGLPQRNVTLSERTAKIISSSFDPQQYFLDYAGGYGMFTRMMRDKGFKFYHTDVYCQNLFAEYFDLKDSPANARFELVTAFEVFEHLVDPDKGINELLKFSDNILFSTELVPKKEIKNPGDWWYFIPETGQHISLYTEKALASLAEEHGLFFHTDGIGLHLFTKVKFAYNPVQTRDPFLLRKMKKLVKNLERSTYPSPESLLQADWEMINSKLKDL